MRNYLINDSFIYHSFDEHLLHSHKDMSNLKNVRWINDVAPALEDLSEINIPWVRIQCQGKLVRKIEASLRQNHHNSSEMPTSSQHLSRKIKLPIGLSHLGQVPIIHGRMQFPTHKYHWLICSPKEGVFFFPLGRSKGRIVLGFWKDDKKLGQAS